VAPNPAELCFDLKSPTGITSMAEARDLPAKGRAMTQPRQRIETRIEARLVGVTLLQRGGDLQTLQPAAARAEDCRLHLQAVAPAMQTRASFLATMARALGAAGGLTVRMFKTSRLAARIRLE
jgi:hypothetical protein